jgi:hypothetical protein
VECEEVTETKVDANNAEPFNDYARGSALGPALVGGEVARIFPGKSDFDRAADLKQRGQVAFASILALMDEAASAGFLLRWGGIAPNAFGKHELVDLHLLKKF